MVINDDAKCLSFCCIDNNDRFAVLKCMRYKILLYIDVKILMPEVCIITCMCSQG